MSEPKPRKPRDLTGPQQVCRIPPFRPGMWVKIKLGVPDLGGRVKRVKSLTCSITQPAQRVAVWRVVFDDLRCLEVHAIEREATAEETARAERGQRL